MSVFEAKGLFYKAGEGGGDSHNKGYYATPQALQEAHPTANPGDFAIVESTDTIWIWDTDNSEWVDSHKTDSVTSVNGQTGAVVLDAEDVGALPDDTPIPDPQVNSDWNATSGVAEILNKPTIPSTAQQVGAVPQYETMPTASASNLGEVAQYAGMDTNDYKNGHFYKSEATYTDPVATISQTAGSGLTDLAVDIDTFVAEEQPSGAETVSFVYDPDISLGTKTSESFSITITDMDGLVSALQSAAWQNMPLDLAIKTMNFGTDENNSAQFWLNNATWKFYARYVDIKGTSRTFNVAVDNYISVTGTPQVDDCQFLLDMLLWKKNNVKAIIEDYGVEYEGAPVVNDELTISYTPSILTGYAWIKTYVDLPDQTNHEGQFLFTNGSTASWRDDVFTNTTSHTFSVDENTSEVYVQIYPKENRNCFARVRVYDTWDDGGTPQKDTLLRTDYFRFDYYDLSGSSENKERTEQITPCLRLATPNIFAGYKSQKCFGFIMTFSEEESKDYIVDIDYSDGVESITYDQNVWLNQIYATANILFSGELLTGLDDEFVVMASKTNGLFPSDLREAGSPYFVAKYTEAPDPSTVTTPWQYIGETDSDYVKGYFYDRTQSDDRNATATVTIGSFSVSINQTTFAENATQDYPNSFVEWAYETTLHYSQSQGGWYSWSDLDTAINLASVGITITGTVHNDDRFTVAYGNMYKWKQVDVQPTPVIPDPLPSQTGNNGKFLSTNGTTASWETVGGLPSQTGQSGKFLVTDGTNASWSDKITNPIYFQGHNRGECSLYIGDSSGTYGGQQIKLFNQEGSSLMIESSYLSGTVKINLGDTTSVFALNALNGVNLGTSTYKWTKVYTTKINNGADIDVPNTAGTMVVAVPPTTPNTVWLLKATVDANGDHTVAWVQEV